MTIIIIAKSARGRITIQRQKGKRGDVCVCGRVFHKALHRDLADTKDTGLRPRGFCRSRLPSRAERETGEGAFKQIGSLFVVRTIGRNQMICLTKYVTVFAISKRERERGPEPLWRFPGCFSPLPRASAVYTVTAAVTRRTPSRLMYPLPPPPPVSFSITLCIYERTAIQRNILVNCKSKISEQRERLRQKCLCGSALREPVTCYCCYFASLFGIYRASLDERRAFLWVRSGCALCLMLFDYDRALFVSNVVIESPEF